VRGFCRRILGSGDLAAKLAPPRSEDGRPLADVVGPPVLVDAPARDPGLALVRGAPRLPRPGELVRPQARARCLARFAHHELMAVELFAWALLRWPRLPPSLRRGFLRVLAEEQAHCRLYLERLEAHGSDLSEHALSGYFWRHVPGIAASAFGPRAFLCAMGLTYEQANLDFAGLYARAFRDAGDEASARVCERVHADEVGHVRLAAVWNGRLAGPGKSDLDAYREAVPFPLSPARAKGRRFDAEARRRAGLSPAFVDCVRAARSSAESAPRRG
jgi:uncharacterized ferritin-like protein (DUF455 family)